MNEIPQPGLGVDLPPDSVPFLWTAIESLDDAIAILNLDGSIQKHNSAFSRLWNNGAADSGPPINVDSLFHGKNSPPSLDEFAKVPTVKWTGDTRFRAANKALIPVKAVLTKVLDNAGAVIGFSLSLKDRTESISLDERLRMFEMAVENCLEPVLITEAEPIDLPGPRIVYANKAFTEVTGYTREEVIGKTPRILQGPRSNRNELDKIRRALTNWKPVKVELLNYRKDGTEFWVELGIFPVADEKGWYTHWVAVQRETTERKLFENRIQFINQELEEKVALRTRELSQANRLKDEFLASMSHELRTPLNGVLGLTEAIKEEVYGPVTPDQNSALEDIAISGRHLLSLINDILDLSKTQAGQIVLDIAPTSVEQVCQASYRLVKEICLKKQLKFHLNLEKAPSVILADERRLKQILVNLLGNSVKFTMEKGSIGLDVIGDEDNEQVSFSVWDTGIGIPKEKVELLFKPFQQIDSRLSRHYNGTGLGLALVLGMAELHHGSVGVISEECKGSRFTVNLPWSKRDLDEHGLKEAASRGALQAQPEPELSHQNGPLILLAEDNNTNARFVQDYLRSCGFKVIRAFDGIQTLELARQSRPELILMDIQMPEMDGLHATRELRKDSITKDIPILAVSALALEGDREKCLDAGASDYLSKPFALKKLRNMMDQLLEKANTKVPKTKS